MKKLSIILLLSLMMVGLSSCDKHYWSDLSGSRWYAVEGVDGYSRYYISNTDLDYMEIQFYGDGTGRMEFYDEYGYWVNLGFDWDDYGDYVLINYFDGGQEYFYYDFAGGYLYLSRNRYMNSYTIFSH